MNAEITPPKIGESEKRKPRVAIMGEFSSGKSTLTNLLIGEPALPVQITATQLPPVWISEGIEPSYRIGLDGSETPIELEDLPELSLGETQFLRVFKQSDVLAVCDIIDMPGISDPNMSSEVWERVSHFADAVIWCTHATQAWRQSESAVWESFPENLFDKSLLLMTRFDKIIAERDRKRLIHRVERETEGLFRGVFPISLVESLDAGEDSERWQNCGADAFVAALIDLLMEDAPKAAVTDDPVPQSTDKPSSVADMLVLPLLLADRHRTAKSNSDRLSPLPGPATAAGSELPVTPRRVDRPLTASVTSLRPPRKSA